MIGSRPGSGAASAYRMIDGLGSTPENHLKLGLDAARSLLLRADMAIAAADQIGKARALAAAGNIVEFMLGLTGAAPGALSERLAGVYQYVLAAILKGNAGNDREAVGAARVALDELAGVWRSIFPDETSEGVGAEMRLSESPAHA